MRKAKVSPENYINFLIAAPKACSAVEAAKVQPCFPDSPAHDSFTRLLNNSKPDPEALWKEAEPSVRLDDGILILDDSVLDPMRGTFNLSADITPASITASFLALTSSVLSGPMVIAPLLATFASFTRASI